MSKIDRAVHGPGWAEVILGAVLSLLLGILLGALALALRPVAVVKELPKPEERKRDTVYYVEGSKDTNKVGQALAKRNAFIAGQSVTVTEDEVNAMLIADAGAAKPAAAGEGAKSAESVAVGAPNVRIRNGAVQVGAPVTMNVLGLSEKIIVQARGGFAKKGDVFTYAPSEIYLGSLPVQRLPVLSGYVRNQIVSARQFPDEITAAWRKLSDVSIDGNTVRLSP